MLDALKYLLCIIADFLNENKGSFQIIIIFLLPCPFGKISYRALWMRNIMPKHQGEKATNLSQPDMWIVEECVSVCVDWTVFMLSWQM